MATSTERMRALRERKRRGLRRFTVGVSEDDLRVIAEHGYGGAASGDQDQQAQAVSLFITDMLRRDRPWVTALRRPQRRYSNGSPPLQRRFSRPENSIGAVRPPVAGLRAGARTPSGRS